MVYNDFVMPLPKEPQTASAKESEGLEPQEGKKYPVVERQVIPEVPPEIEKVEAVAGAEANLAQPVTDDAGRVIVSPSAPQQVNITWPLTDEEIEKALHLKVIYSIRWLAEWTARLLKKTRHKLIPAECSGPAGRCSCSPDRRKNFPCRYCLQ